MQKDITVDVTQLEIPKCIGTSRVKTYKTAVGLVLLRTCCPPALVEGLQVDDGLRAFARTPQREHELLLQLARHPENRLTLAYTPSGKIVGQATLAPLDGWWQGIEKAYEVAIEVSPAYRNLGVAHQLLSLALEFDAVEEYLFLSLGLSWHWDYRGLGMSRFQYREVIARLFAAHGFAEYLTSEQNIQMDPANILVARLGRSVEEERINQFFERLFQSEGLPGL
jgi:GNAT superfamily N-acetyltransferase